MLPWERWQSLVGSASESLAPGLIMSLRKAARHAAGGSRRVYPKLPPKLRPRSYSGKGFHLHSPT
jgi:hypothetical protein